MIVTFSFSDIFVVSKLSYSLFLVARVDNACNMKITQG